jgi:hypothetical protein
MAAYSMLQTMAPIRPEPRTARRPSWHAINEAFNVATSKHTMSGVHDLGGVEIHLEGGNYLISEPLQLPASGGGNVLVMK